MSDDRRSWPRPGRSSWAVTVGRRALRVRHAADDRLGPYEHVEPAAERIPSSRLITVETGGHLFLRHAAEVREATTVFIAEVLLGAGSEAER